MKEVVRLHKYLAQAGLGAPEQRADDPRWPRGDQWQGLRDLGHHH